MKKDKKPIEVFNALVTWRGLSLPASQAENMERVCSHKALSVAWAEGGITFIYRSDAEFMLRRTDARGVHCLEIDRHHDAFSYYEDTPTAISLHCGEDGVTLELIINKFLDPC